MKPQDIITIVAAFGGSAGAGVRIKGTDPETVSWLLKQIQETKLSHRISKHQTLFGIAVAGVDKLNYRDEEMALYLLKCLLSKGWEPYASGSEISIDSGWFVSLRKARETAAD